ncbi:hypothetical protein U6B65_11020 [Oscillospiraceae bacterium MB08-C2-2]|nr:hypothetical protein U6B65_11020 [Oscillospiraceae bacterium MB08-C2-2]
MIDGVVEMKTSLFNWLDSSSMGRSVLFVMEYPSYSMAGPQKESQIVISVERLEVLPGGLGGYAAANSTGQPITGKTVRGTLILEIFAAPRHSGNRCSFYFDELRSVLLLPECPVAVRSITAGKIFFDPEAGANRLPVRVQVEFGWAQG